MLTLALAVRSKDSVHKAPSCAAKCSGVFPVYTSQNYIALVCALTTNLVLDVNVGGRAKKRVQHVWIPIQVDGKEQRRHARLR